MGEGSRQGQGHWLTGIGGPLMPPRECLDPRRMGGDEQHTVEIRNPWAQNALPCSALCIPLLLSDLGTEAFFFFF